MSRSVTTMTIEDAEHYTPEQRQAIIDSYPEHEREARVKGVPSLGSGRVFPVSEDKLRCPPHAIAPHWAQINGLDFGIDHPFAAVGVAWDRDADCVYVTREYRESGQTPPMHAAAIRPWGDWVPCAWPHDGLQHDKGSGLQLAEQYRVHGLKMLDEHATHEEGGYGIEAGVLEMRERMDTGRLKVFDTCRLWFEEFRIYHRVKGLIVKERDDLLSATRYAIMMLREAKIKPKVVKLRYDTRGIV